MSYLDNDFNVFLDKFYQPSSSITALDFDADVESFDASKVVSGILRSTDGRTAVDLDKSLFSVNDGLIDRVEVGKFDDGEYGLRIRDREGNILVDITGTKNLLQSADQKMQLDLTDKQFRVFDQFNLRILLGILARVQ